MLVQLSREEHSFQQYHTLLGRLNVVLVEILKHEWPHDWPTFIPEIVDASQSAETLCENNLNILKLLAEEVFEFSEDHLTSEKGKAERSDEHCAFVPQDTFCCSFVVFLQLKH